MANLTLFIGVGNRTSLQLLHRLEGLFQTGGERLESRTVEMHPTDIEPEAEIVVIPKQIAKALPLGLAIDGAEIREAHLWRRTFIPEPIRDCPRCPRIGISRLFSRQNC